MDCVILDEATLQLCNREATHYIFDSVSHITYDVCKYHAYRIMEMAGRVYGPYPEHPFMMFAIVEVEALGNKADVLAAMGEIHAEISK